MEYAAAYDYHHGEGFSEHALSPWEDRHFWESTDRRAANNNHFYRTGSSFTDSSGVQSSADATEDSEAEHGAKDDDDYQVMVERVVDENGRSSYQVKTNEENMDDDVKWALASGTSDGIKDNNAGQKSTHGSIFRPPYDARLYAEAPPPLALSASSSSEATTEVEEDVLRVVLVDQEQVVATKQEQRSTRRGLLAPCVFLALIICYIAYLLSTHTIGAKLTGTLVHHSAVHDAIANAVNGNDSVGLITQIVSLFKALTSIALWRSHANELVSGALQTSWVKW